MILSPRLKPGAPTRFGLVSLALSCSRFTGCPTLPPGGSHWFSSSFTRLIFCLNAQDLRYAAHSHRLVRIRAIEFFPCRMRCCDERPVGSEVFVEFFEVGAVEVL